MLPIGLATMVDLLVDGARHGWSDEQLRALLQRLVPEFGASEVDADFDVEVARSLITAWPPPRWW